MVGRAGQQRPVGTVTRGTTNPNRLRRVDRWLAGPQAWRLRRSPTPPVVVDLGYGASPVTAVELHDRLRRVRTDVEVVGIEIERARVDRGTPLERPGLSFRVGGFEVPLGAGRQATVVRAFNVLRQYDESQVARRGPPCRTGWRPTACSSTAPATSSAGWRPGSPSTAADRCL